jgi:hypothetical protein
MAAINSLTRFRTPVPTVASGIGRSTFFPILPSDSRRHTSVMPHRSHETPTAMIVHPSIEWALCLCDAFEHLSNVVSRIHRCWLN